MVNQEFLSSFRQQFLLDQKMWVPQKVTTLHMVVTHEIARHGSVPVPCHNYSLVIITVKPGVTALLYDVAPQHMLCMREVTIAIEEGAHVTYEAHIPAGTVSSWYEHCTVTVNANGTFIHKAWQQGGQEVIKKYTYQLAGAGASVEYNGRVHVGNEQKYTLQWDQLHQAPDTKSTVTIKTVADGKAVCDYVGSITVAKEAVRSCAYQQHRAILLSDRAQVRSVPTLEVATHQVQCGHGSAVAPLDESYFFYCAARGIGREKAQKMLIDGFLELKGIHTYEK